MNRLVKVKVLPNDPELTLEWASVSEAGVPLIYAVGLNWVEQRAEIIRKQLNLFIIDFTNGNISFRERRGFRRCREHLQKLAKYGSTMYLALTEDARGEPPWSQERMNEWLADRGEDVTVSFAVPSNLYIPWGLLYNGDPEKLVVDDTEPRIEEYEDFWCVKYRASSYHANLPLMASSALAGESFRLLSAVNNDVFEKAYEVLPEAEQGTAKWFWGEESKLPVAYDRVKLKEEWQKVSSDSGILYFYCHANGTKIEFSRDETVTAEQLHLDLRRDPRHRCVNLAFFNGCNTVVGPDVKSGDTGQSFAEILRMLRFRGHVGTEAKIPDVFALRFGFDFLFYFLHGKGSLLDAMSSLRRKHWPISLVYSIHCDPLVSIARQAPPEFPEQFSEENFSLDRVGSNLLTAAPAA